MKIRMATLVWGFICLAAAGCAGNGEVMLVDIPDQGAVISASMTPPQGLRVAVEQFEDSRPAKSRLGTRSHLWGGESHFEVPGESLGVAAAQALVRYLNRNGWQSQLVRPGAGSNNADVTISGHLLALSLDAKSRVGSTKLTTASKLAIRALNRVDGSTVRMTLNGAGSDTVLWFEPGDGQQLINTVLDDSFSRFLQSTKVQDKALRLRE